MRHFCERTNFARHFCERTNFAKRRDYEVGKDGYQFKYEVWDNHCAEDPEWDDPTTTSVKVFQSDDKSECEAFIRQGAQRCELEENGVCKVCDLYDQRQADMKSGRVRPYYLVVSSTSRHYGGPEEGGWWYDNTSITEVRRAFTLEEGLRQARELREKYPQPRYNRFSCANRGEGDTRIQLCYGENDPRWPQENHERPRYE